MRTLALSVACLIFGTFVAPAGLHAQGEWQTVPGGPDTRCGLGDPFQFYARIAHRDSLLVFLGGGGACWNPGSCDPRGNAPIRARNSVYPAYNGILDIWTSVNPFKNYSMVEVPYCTGDLHLGSRAIEYGRGAEDSSSSFVYHHVGARNARAVLDWIAEQFPSPAQIVVVGQSAGAIPTPYLAALLARRYPSAHVVGIGNGGGALRAAGFSSSVLRHWGADSVLIAEGLIEGTAGKPMTFEDLYIGAARVVPNLRLARVDCVADGTQAMLLRALGLGDSPVSTMLTASMSEIEAAVPEFRYFVAPGDQHTLFSSGAFYTAASEGVRLLQWTADLAHGREVTTVGRALLNQSEAGAEAMRFSLLTPEPQPEDAGWVRVSPSDTGAGGFSLDRVLGVWETVSIGDDPVPGPDLEFVRFTFLRRGQCSYWIKAPRGERRSNFPYTINEETQTITIDMSGQVWEGSVEGDTIRLTAPRTSRQPAQTWILHRRRAVGAPRGPGSGLGSG